MYVYASIHPGDCFEKKKKKRENLCVERVIEEFGQHVGVPCLN